MFLRFGRWGRVMLCLLNLWLMERRWCAMRHHGIWPWLNRLRANNVSLGRDVFDRFNGRQLRPLLYADRCR